MDIGRSPWIRETARHLASCGLWKMVEDDGGSSNRICTQGVRGSNPLVSTINPASGAQNQTSRAARAASLCAPISVRSSIAAERFPIYAASMAGDEHPGFIDGASKGSLVYGTARFQLFIWDHSE